MNEANDVDDPVNRNLFSVCQTAFELTAKQVRVEVNAFALHLSFLSFSLILFSSPFPHLPLTGWP